MGENIYSLYGVNVSTARYKYSCDKITPLQVCFSFYPRKFFNCENINNKLYLYIYLYKEVEDNFKQIRSVFSNYNLKIKPMYYVNKVSIDKWNTKVYMPLDLDKKEECLFGLYRISIGLSKIPNKLAKYYISLLVFMFIRFYSPGENYDNGMIIKPFINTGITINNTNSCHTMTRLRNLTIDDLNMLNNIEFINSIFTEDVSSISYKENKTDVYPKKIEVIDPKTETTVFISYLREKLTEYTNLNKKGENNVYK